MLGAATASAPSTRARSPCLSSNYASMMATASSSGPRPATQRTGASACRSGESLIGQLVDHFDDGSLYLFTSRMRRPIAKHHVEECKTLDMPHNTLVGLNLRDQVRIGASGKIISGFDVARTLALGADWC